VKRVISVPQFKVRFSLRFVISIGVQDKKNLVKLEGQREFSRFFEILS
jgi:hypothetical protein